jgi:hypothetical protein
MLLEKRGSWVCALCLPDPEWVMLREWLPLTDFSRFNEMIGGLEQLLGKGEKKLAFEVEKQLGYKNIISSLLKKKK